MKVSFCFETLEFQFCLNDFVEALKSTKIYSYEPVSSEKYENGCRTKMCDFAVNFC